MSIKDTFLAGLFKENPVFVLLLALCPALGVTNTLENSLGMGFTVLFVLTASNTIISVFRKVIPTEIRIPVFIIIIASAATILEMFMAAFLPDLFNALGIFLPLVVTNCIVFGRAESFASKNSTILSAADGVGMGLGFTLALVMIGSFRELVGTGAFDIFGFYFRLFPVQFAISLFIQPAGAFIALGLIVGIMFSLKFYNDDKKALKAREVH